MPKMPPRKPKRSKEPKGMESLFPNMRARTKAAEYKEAAYKRARWVLDIIDAFTAKGYIERGQSETLKKEAKRIMMLYNKGRLTASNARFFLELTSWIEKYLEG